jgi:hypothetical protein
MLSDDVGTNMRIDFSAPVDVTDEDDDVVTDPSVLSRLDGVTFPDILFTDYFGGSPEETAVAVLLDRGGTITIVADGAAPPLHAITSYRAARELSDDELAVLENYTAGQWSDGAGEGLIHEDWSIQINERQIRCRQYDDGVRAAGTGTVNLYPAIRNVDYDGVVRALDEGERIDSTLSGYPPLQWALLFADARIAMLLIDRGADVHALSPLGDTALATCASANTLSDADAAEITAVLLSRGGFERAEWERTMEIAENRGKSKLNAVLKSNPVA